MSEHKLYGRIYSDERAKIIAENFGISCESELPLIFYNNPGKFNPVTSFIFCAAISCERLIALL